MAIVNSYTQDMPTPQRTSLTAITTAARELLELDGLGGVTMQAVAQRVGVRAPSLYKRVRNRDELIRLVAESVLADLALTLGRSTSLADLADRFREFGHTNPAGFRLVMAPGAGVPVARPQFGEAAAEPVLRLCAELAGKSRALEAARTVTAWAVGFVSMELNGGFNLGGSVNHAWAFGVRSMERAMRG